MAKVRDRIEDFKDAVNRGALSLGFNEVGFNFFIFSLFTRVCSVMFFRLTNLHAI